MSVLFYMGLKIVYQFFLFLNLGLPKRFDRLPKIFCSCWCRCEKTLVCQRIDDAFTVNSFLLNVFNNFV